MAEACTVLIAAGDPGLAASLRFSLEQEGYAASLCDELSLASSLGAECKPSCVVVDQDVFAKLSLLGSQVVTESGIPVILLLSQATPRLLDRARAAGVTRMVEKPLAGDALLAEIRGALEGLRAAQMTGV